MSSASEQADLQAIGRGGDRPMRPATAPAGPTMTCCLVFDAAGLALFAVSGTQKALAFDLNPVMAPLLGMLTGIGGGMVRDLLVAEIPTVLCAELYAVAALAGAAVVVIGSLLHLSSIGATIIGAALCFGLRVMAIQRGWNLPIARPRNQSQADQATKVHENDDNTLPLR